VGGNAVFELSHGAVSQGSERRTNPTGQSLDHQGIQLARIDKPE
jgi:hypothetical protein